MNGMTLSIASSDGTPGYPAPETACIVVTTARSMPKVLWRGAAASANVIAEQLPLVTIEPDQPRFFRCTSSAAAWSGLTSAMISGTSASSRCVFTFENT